MSSELYLAYLATVGIFFASPPGPSQVLMISNSLRHGVNRSLATAAGDLSANSLQMLAAAFGLAAIIATSSDILVLIKWAGVAYLCYIGIRTFRAPLPALSVSGDVTVTGYALYGQGFFTSAANPRAVFFFAALFPQFIDAEEAIWPQLLILGSTYLLIDGILLVLWGKSAEKLLGRLRHRGRLLNRASGSMMVGAAALLGLKEVEAK